MNHNEIKVWDPLVRLFHWGLVAAFFIAYFTEEELLDPHVVAGYIVMGLVAFRLAWGVVGPRHARFTSFVSGPATVFAHVRDVLGFRGRRYLGHTPAGGWMIVLLLISLVLISVTGLAVYGIAEHAGPLAGMFAGAGEEEMEFFEELHEISANFTLLLVGVHVLGVIWESRLHRESLVRAMITGRKREL